MAYHPAVRELPLKKLKTCFLSFYVMITIAINITVGSIGLRRGKKRVFLLSFVTVAIIFSIADVQFLHYISDSSQPLSASDIYQFDTNPNEFNSRRIHRLVHLDLKGAPPKLEYLRIIIPLLREWGATGLLIEYEDMFPYKGKLGVIARNDAYDISTINEILDLAMKNDLIIIPLIQTFSHLEFVLKHGEFSHLREIEDKEKILNPAHKDSLGVVTEMIDQVLSLHPKVKYLHIGCNEVYKLGSSKESQELMKQQSFDRNDLFLYHVKRVLEHIHEKHPGVKPIMWDDMLQGIKGARLKQYDFHDLVEPMIGYYKADAYKQFDDSFWDNYATVFDHVWVASAFKCTTGYKKIYTTISYHIENQVGWLKVMQKTHDRHYPRMTFGGIALMGPQRYDHNQPLCELLPVGIPSLVGCMQLIMHGNYSDKIHKLVSDTLRCQSLINLAPARVMPDHVRCKFPGFFLYDLMVELRVTQIGVAKLGEMKTQKSSRRDLLALQIHSLLRRMPEVLLAMYSKDTTREFMEGTFFDGLDRLPDVNQEARTMLYEIYPWMKADESV